MSYCILIFLIIITYTILITIQIEIFKKLLEIEKILWKIIDDKIFDIIFKK